MKRLLDRIFAYFEMRTKPFPERQLTSPPRGLLRFFGYFSRDMKLPLALMSVITASISVLEVSLFSFLGNLVDWLSAQNPEMFFAEQGLVLVGMGSVLIVALPVLSFLHAVLVHQSLLGNYPMSIRWILHRYLLHQSVSFYHNEFAGRVATKVMQTALAIRECGMKILDIFVFVGVYFCSMLVLMGQQDWRLVLPWMAWLLGYIVLQWHFMPALRSVSESQAEARADMTGRLVDSYTNVTTLKLFSHTSAELDYAQASMQTFLKTVYRQMRMVTGLHVSVQCLNYVLIFVCSGLALLLWRYGEISLGAIAIAVSLSLRLNSMSQWVMWEISAISEHMGTVIDGANTLTHPLGVQDREGAKNLEVQDGKVDFHDVTFGYDKQHPVFDRLRLSIQGGEKVGIVGRSGAGKSTLVNLLLRFYDVQSGSITVDDVDITQVRQESLRGQIGVVTQDNALLHRSVLENIRYGRPSATETEVIDAAKRAQAHEFIVGLTDSNGGSGYYAQVGERGVKLSGGQRQRIAIARVLLKNAPILILDEATSALDSEVEQAIQSNLKLLMQGKTVIAIAHRLSTIAALDRLIVLDEGRIVEMGTHNELLQLDGLYAKLWRHQSGGFIGDV